MAPVHSINSYSFSSSSSEVRSNGHCNKDLVSCWERNLPVSFRGRFFEDSFFESARARYEEKVKRLLEDWDDDWFNTTSCSRAIRNHSIRNSLSRNKEKQIISVTSEDGELKILLDVRDYTIEEIKVRVVGEREVEVEGHQKPKENEASNTNETPNNFRYLISLPEYTEMDEITSAMSSDGILSISVSRKKTFDKICHHIPVEVEGKVVSDFSQSSSKSSKTDCIDVFGKEVENSAKSVQKTEVGNLDYYQSSRQLGEMQESSKSILGVNAINGDNEEKFDESFGIKKTGYTSEESASHSHLRKVNTEDTSVGASENEKRESERHLTNENLCASKVFTNHPITNGNTKVTSSVSDKEYSLNSGDISNKDNNTSLYDALATSTTKKAIETLVMNEVYLKSGKQREELNLPMNSETSLSAVCDVQVQETIGLQNEQSLTDEANPNSNSNKLSLEFSTHENKVPPAEEATKTSTHTNESSVQRMEAYFIQDQTMTGKSFMDSSDINRNLGIFQSDSTLGNNVVTDKTTHVNEQDEITEKEYNLENYKEAQTGVSSSSDISDKYVQDKERRPKCGKNQTYSKDSLEEHKSTENSSSLAHVGVDCTNSSRNVSRNVLIAKKGSFFTDTHFEGMQEYYQKAVRKILSKYGDFPFDCDEMSFYRNLRMQNQEENMAEIIFENENKLHFILDLYNIMKEEEMNVEIVNGQVIMVRRKLKEVNRKDEITSWFSKYFNINKEVDITFAEAALSSEGVLVISIPKKVLQNEESSTGETFQDIQISKSQISEEYLKELSDQNSSDFLQNTETKNKIKCFSENVKLSSGLSESGKSTELKDGEEGKNITDMLENPVVESRNQLNTDDLRSQEVKSKQSIHHNEVVEESANGEGYAYKGQMKSYHKNQQEDEIVNITSDKDKNGCEEVTKHLCDIASEKALTEILQVSQKAIILDNGEHIFSDDLESGNSFLTDKCACISVEERGLFHEDHFFDGMQNHLLKAIREILSNYHDMPATTEDEMTLYRKFIYNHEPKEAYPTASVSFEDEFSYKVVMDAHKFMKIRRVTLGNLIDKIMNISMEDIDEAGQCKCFSKSFAAPDGLDIYNAVAVISSDGILAISIPKQRFLDDSAHQNHVEICEANHSNYTCQSDTPNSAIDAASLQSSSSTVDSHISFTTKMDENAAESNSTGSLNEKREEKIQIRIGYQEKCDQALNIAERSTFKAEIEDDNGGNGNEEDDSDTSTVVGVPCSFEINSLADDESSSYSPIVQYAVTLAESPQVESNGIITSEISGKYKRISEYEAENQASNTASQLFQQSSRLSIHTLDESEMECDDFCPLSSDEISRASSVENCLDWNNDYRRSSGVSDVKENYCINVSMNQAYERENINTNVIQPESMNKCKISKKSLFSSTESAEEVAPHGISSGNLCLTEHNKQMISKQMMSGELFEHSQSQSVIQANGSCTQASVWKRHCNQSRGLTMTKRGFFFEDTFFSEVQETFLTAMREVLRKSSDEDKCKHSSDIASYKCWRKQNPSIENQAVLVCEDHDAHRVVLDIASLLEESVSVFVSDGKELLIEGQSSKTEHTMEEPRWYSRNFILPDEVDVDGITATLSQDGILLIISPKRCTVLT